MPSFVSRLTCSRCERTFHHLDVRGTCECGGPLLVDYDLDLIGARVTREEIARRPETMWRYLELLPVEDPGRIVSLGEGFTPLLEASSLGRRVGLPYLRIKDEGGNPTGTFKARGASAGVTAAVERNLFDVALATAGNAGGAWAAYGDASGVRVHVVMPADAPRVNDLEARAYGADVVSVDGMLPEAAGVVAEGVRESGWFDVSAMREPYRVEGKKTMGFEIAEQLNWRMPTTIVYPTGGGVGLIGIWRAMLQLKELGWAQGDLPRLVMVQAEGCAPLVEAFSNRAPEAKEWPSPRTVAHGLRVPKPFADSLVLQAVRDTEGTAIAVSDDAIRDAMRLLILETGIFAGPEGAAAIAGTLELARRGELSRTERVVVLMTGAGHKAPDDMLTVTAEESLSDDQKADVNESDPSDGPGGTDRADRADGADGPDGAERSNGWEESDRSEGPGDTEDRAEDPDAAEE